MRRIRFSLWVAGWLLAVPVQAATVMVFGDSLSAGYGLRQGEGWVSLLARNLGPGHRVINASQSGETSAGGLTRLPAALAQHKPDVVVLALGGNDGLRGLPLDAMRANLDSMLALVRKQHARPLLVGIELPPNYGSRYAHDFAAVFTGLARRNGVPLVPSLVAGFGANVALFQNDGIHPAAAAQPLMVKLVEPRLRPLL